MIYYTITDSRNYTIRFTNRMAAQAWTGQLDKAGIRYTVSISRA